MNLSLLSPPPGIPNPRLIASSKPHSRAYVARLSPSRVLSGRCNSRLSCRTACVPSVHETAESIFAVSDAGGEVIEDEVVAAVPSLNLASVGEEGRGTESIWAQVKEIVKFAGPATGLWICAPLMSLIDTAVIGQGSSLELAALGPATVVCDNLTYVFMFLSIATSNMVATALAKKDKNEAQHHISMLLFVALASGVVMLFLTRSMGAQILTAFTGPQNLEMVAASNTYVQMKFSRNTGKEVSRALIHAFHPLDNWKKKHNFLRDDGKAIFFYGDDGKDSFHVVLQIRGLAWPAILIGLVAQSASLGMKDSWGPLKALAVASAINGVGDVLLCSFLGYGIAGAAWATMVSQVVAAFMMIRNLSKTGYDALAMTIPSPRELLQIFEIAAPVFLTMISKVAFYSLLIYFATSMGTMTIAAHQVMIGVYCMCTVWGEPLSQTAQSFMPELIYGINRNLVKARMLLKSLVTIGATTGLALGIIGTSFPWLFPFVFTTDKGIITQMHKVLIPYFVALVVTPSTHCLEGTLMAGRDLRFLSLSMTGCFCMGGVLLMVVSRIGGLPGCWWALAGFQWARFTLALLRLLSPRGMLYSEEFHNHVSGS